MSHFDVFNGDADGICALHQLRLVSPMDATLVTGVKRDIALLERVEPQARASDTVTVLDVSLDVNRGPLLALLDRGVGVDYFDHHFAGRIPAAAGLRALIDPAPGVCTGILVDRHLGGRQRIWAIVAAFGDNLPDAALELADTSAPGLAPSPAQLQMLQELGDNLAYNAYGDTESDLIVHPATLYRKLSRYADPFAFMREEPVYAQIDRSRREDLARAQATDPHARVSGATAYLLPDAAWSRRVRGAFANELANRSPDRAHAILTPDARGGYVVSLRAPLARPTGADALCRQFATGGGRRSAAGINHLPQGALPQFLRELERAWPAHG
ncbi:MAG TPA: acetyltransferase [Casimicrobiaceae bacterium]|nr:acetyltransferase [Casimicrobiaceae bacterium]